MRHIDQRTMGNQRMTNRKITEEAARLHQAWVASRRFDPDLHHAVVEWLGQSKEHISEYLIIDNIHRRVGRAMKHEPGSEAADDSAADDFRCEPAKLSRSADIEEPKRPRWSTRRAFLIGTAVASCSGIVALGSVLVGRSEDFLTTGHVRQTVLDTTSTMHAARHSEAQVSSRPDVHRVNVSSGLVAFELGPNVRLELKTSCCQIHAVGARFQVNAGEMDIATVESGTVRVIARADRASLEVQVPAGHAAIVRRDSTVPIVVPVANVSRRLSWTTGMLTFRDESILEVAAAFNQFNDTMIVVSTDVAHFTVGHRKLALNDPEGAMRQIAADDLRLRVVRDARSKTIRILRGSGATV